MPRSPEVKHIISAAVILLLAIVLYSYLNINTSASALPTSEMSIILNKCDGFISNTTVRILNPPFNTKFNLHSGSFIVDSPSTLTRDTQESSINDIYSSTLFETRYNSLIRVTVNEGLTPPNSNVEITTQCDIVIGGKTKSEAITLDLDDLTSCNTINWNYTTIVLENTSSHGSSLRVGDLEYFVNQKSPGIVVSRLGSQLYYIYINGKPVALNNNKLTQTVDSSVLVPADNALLTLTQEQGDLLITNTCQEMAPAEPGRGGCLDHCSDNILGTYKKLMANFK